ncbi:MAG TPA: hypothetical protein VE997_04300, partial [Candidatus Limnocylindria bacterium]|nr:hypothetical protein [Candidatus Limnocylindria bacterium]
DLPPDGPGFSYKNPQLGVLRDGSAPGYGHSYDLDQLNPQAVDTYDTIVARRRPDSSRPPAPFERIFQGRFYDVWRKRGDTQVVAHLPAGAGLEAAGHVRCGELRRAISDAGPGVSVAYVDRPLLAAVNPARARRSPAWAETGSGGVGLYTPGELTANVDIAQGGRYRVWLKGEFGRELRVYVNGRRVGAISYESGNEGNYGQPIDATLEPGRNRLTIERGGGSLRPGDGMSGTLRAILFEPDGVRTDVRTAATSDWRTVCRRTVDWVELVR